MSTKRGLGKGVNALIPDTPLSNKNPEKVVEKIVEKKVIVKEPAEVELSINEVEPNRGQPRKNFNEEGLAALADSINQYGIVEPLVVQRKDDHYEIIAGERRWRAARIAGLKKVPVIIKNYSELEAMEVALIENLQREDLNPIEEAKAYELLIKEYNLKQEDVARKVSKSRTAITNSVRLLKLSSKVQDMLVEGVLSSGHAKTLITIEDKNKQLAIAEKIVAEGLSVRDAEKLVRDLNKPVSEKKPARKSSSSDAIYRKYESELKSTLGTKVIIHNKENNTGTIEITYSTADEFEKIAKLLKR